MAKLNLYMTARLLVAIFVMPFHLLSAYEDSSNNIRCETWEKNFSEGMLSRCIEIDDGGTLAVGTTRLAGFFKMLIIRTDSCGKLLWSKTVGEIDRNYDGRWCAQSNDGCILLTGSCQDINDNELFLLKLDKNGNILWSRKFAGLYGLRVFESDHSSIILSGGTTLGMKILKTDHNGNILWERVLDNNFHLDMTIVNTGYLVLSYYFGGNKLTIINEAGSIVWEREHVGSSNGVSIRECEDFKFVMAGFDLSNKCTITKIDNKGLVEWEKRYEITGSEIVHNIEVLPGEEGYLVSGSAENIGTGQFSAFLRMVDIKGNELFSKSYMPVGYEYDYAEFRSGIPNSKGGFLLAGSLNVTSVGLTYVVKSDSHGNITSVHFQSSQTGLPLCSHLFQNFPNPFNPTTQLLFQVYSTSIISLIVMDTKGNMIMQLLSNSKFEAGVYSIKLNGSSLASGIYFCRLDALPMIKSYKSVRISKSMILLK